MNVWHYGVRFSPISVVVNNNVLYLQLKQLQEGNHPTPLFLLSFSKVWPYPAGSTPSHPRTLKYDPNLPSWYSIHVTDVLHRL